MKRISIAGIDGSGKTTLATGLKEKHQETVLFLPQTYKDPTLPLYDLSKTIDAIGKWADINNVAVMKGISLFLGMTLYHPLVNHIEQTKNPKRLIVERHPIIDTMAYAKFFLPMLPKPLPENEIYQGLKKTISEEQLQLVQTHIKNLTKDKTLTTMNEFILNLLKHDQEQVLENLKNFYQLNPPDLHILLTLSPEAIPERFTDRKVVGAHENAKILTMLQQEMIKVCEFIKLNSKDFDFKIINARKSAPQVELEVREII